MKSSIHSREYSLSKGKAQRAAHRKGKKIFGVIACVGLLGALLVGGTVAWLTSTPSSVTNTFTMVNGSTEIEEDITSSSKKDVRVTNNSDVPMYVRATYSVSWVKLDAGANTVDTRIVALGTDFVVTHPSSSSWLCDGASGIYYHVDPVAPGSSTGILISEIKVADNAEPPAEDFILSVEIVSESIQAVPTDAVEDAWAAVDVDGNGKLVLAGAGA